MWNVFWIYVFFFSCKYKRVVLNGYDRNSSIEVGGVFLNLSKAIDKDCQEGLIYKLKRLGICGTYSRFTYSFLAANIKELFSMGNHPTGYKLKLVFHNSQFLHL